jgi:hypothetical protein
VKPRIYTYRVTFEETPDWYWGVHKERKYGESYLGSPVSHAWKWDFYNPFLEILELFPYTEEGWLEACEVEKRCIRPDLNNPFCLNENAGGFVSLETSRAAIRKMHKITHAEKDKNGKSVNAVKFGKAAHKEKDKSGRSIHAVKAFGKVHEEKDDLGRSLHALKLHEEKDDNGKSILGVKNGERLNRDKDKNGKSINAVKAGIASNLERDKDGKSVSAKKRGKATRDKLGNEVLVTFPDGSQQRFNSIRETGCLLGVTDMSVRRRIKRGPSLNKGSKLLGYSFELV